MHKLFVPGLAFLLTLNAWVQASQGKLSGKAVDTLQSLGFKAPYNMGGFVDLKTAGLPAEP